MQVSKDPESLFVRNQGQSFLFGIILPWSIIWFGLYGDGSKEEV